MENRYYKNLDFSDEQVEGLKNLLLASEWSETPASKHFRTKEEFLISDKPEVGARGDLIFVSFFDKYDKDYTNYLLQIDNEELLQNLFSKWCQILKSDEFNHHLFFKFKDWYYLEFKPLWDRLYKKD